MSSALLKRVIPLADRVLVKRLIPSTKTAGGLILPESKVGKSNQGEVVAVGPGYKTRDGDLVEVSVKVGDQVLLPEYGGLPLKLGSDEDEVFLFRNDEILAKLSA